MISAQAHTSTSDTLRRGWRLEVYREIDNGQLQIAVRQVEGDRMIR